MADSEISVKADGVVLKGDVVDDVRPLVRRGAQTAESVLRLLDNVVRLPLDYVSNNLERFRVKYAERFEEIPVDQRREPPMRVGCSVLKNVAYSADEPDIQELFANLLASASNTEKVKNVHPGFATVVGELSSLDARLVIWFFDQKIHRQIYSSQIAIEGATPSDISQSISNLVRLGVLDWKEKIYEERELAKFVGRENYGMFIRQEDMDRLVVNLVNDLQRLKNELIGELRMQHQRQMLEITEFGRNFIASVHSR